MTSSDIEQRAARLIEEEDNKNREIARKRAEQEKEGRLKSAIEKVKREDRERRIAARAKQAKAEARALEPEIERARREADDALASLMRSINEVEGLEQKRSSLLAEAGEPQSAPIRGELRWWLHSHLGDRAELDREQKARVTLRGEPAPFTLSAGTE